MIVSFGRQEVHLRDYFYILRKHRGAIVVFILSVLLAGVGFTLFEKVLFRATSTILIERENPNVVDFKEVMAFDASTSDYYQTQFLMLKSETLIKRLIEEEVLMEDPYFKTLQKGFLRRFLKDIPFLPSWMSQFIAERSPEELFIKKMLDIEPVRNSRLVEVSVMHPNPRRAAELTNSLVSLFIRRNLEDRFLLSQQAGKMISDQLEDLKEKVTKAEGRLQQYMEDNDLVNIPSIRGKNEFLQEAKLELVKIQAEESKLGKRYLPAHPKRIHIRSQIEGLEEKIAEEEQKILGLGRIAVDYAQYERERDSSRQIYEALSARLEETASEAKTQASNIIIVDLAQPQPRPYKPRPLLNMLVALFIGVCGGILLAFFMEYLDSTIKIPDDVEKGLGLELFGIIPASDKRKKGPGKGEVIFDPTKPSPVAESFRALRTALLFRLRQVPGCRVLLVTSPNPEEGKTTVSMNLAAAFQQNHLKVLLVDADLRKPRLYKVFELPSERGLTEILEGEADFQDAVHQDIAGPGLDFLSSGLPSHHPTEILGSHKMDDLMKRIRSVYDIILFDSPPFLAVADVAVLSEHVDAMVIATKYHKTDKRHLREIRKRFQVASKIVGVVINQVSVREKDYYYQQYYYYGYGDEVRKRKK